VLRAELGAVRLDHALGHFSSFRSRGFDFLPSERVPQTTSTRGPPPLSAERSQVASSAILGEQWET